MSWRTMFVTLAIATMAFMTVLGLHSPQQGPGHNCQHLDSLGNWSECDYDSYSLPIRAWHTLSGS
jgi:hypothetical protein